jgi:hypothetical protein
MLGPKFLQLYLTTSREILERILPKATENGYLAIVITCAIMDLIEFEIIHYHYLKKYQRL